jgi:hypothetical protein
VRAAVTGQGYPEHQRRRLTLVLHGSVQEIEVNGHQLQPTQGRVTFDNQGAAFDVTLKVS